MLLRQRLTLVILGLVVLAFGAYQLTLAGPSVSSSGTGDGDCADTAMAALTRVTDASARAAYACLGADMKTTTEDQFVASMQQHATATGKADRVADRHTSDGGKIVFYTVTGANVAPVGYIVYLDPQGKVVKVE